MNRETAQDLLEGEYGGNWSWDDPEWWADMTEMIMEYRNVRQFRKANPDWRLPPWWPGQPEHGTRPPRTPEPPQTAREGR